MGEYKGWGRTGSEENRLNCLRKETRHTKKEGNTDGSDERDYIAGAICDIEIVK